MARLIVDQVLQQAQSYVKDGKIDKARTLYQTVLDRFPENEQAHKGLDELQLIRTDVVYDHSQEAIKQLLSLYEQGQLVSVAEQSLKLTSQYPKNYVFWSIFGFANKSLGRHQDAEFGFRNAIILNPDDPKGHINIGIALKNQGKLKESIKAYDEAIFLNPKCADAYNNKGNALRDLGKLEDAMNAYDKALSFEPTFAEVYNNIGNVYQDQDQREDAIKAYDKALLLEPNFVEAYYNKGNVLNEHGKVKESIVAFENAINLRPDYAEAYNGKGNAFKNQGQWRNAIEAYKQAIFLKPGFINAYYNMGEVYVKLGKLKQAVSAYGKAISFKPDFFQAYNQMGNSLLVLDEVDKAISAYRKAISFKPDFVEALNNLGNTLLNQDKLYEAIDCYHRAISLRPNLADSYNNLGNACYTQGNLEKALDAYNMALTCRPKYAEAYNNMGLTLQEKGQLKEAKKAFNQALLLEPNNPKAHFNLSLLYNIQGNFRVGLKLYEWRTRVKEKNVRPARKELTWDGSKSINGKNVFVYEEQGLGDVIQFCRYLLLLQKNGAFVTFKVRSPLHQLLSSLDVQINLTNSFPKNQQIDFEMPLMSIPYLLGTRLKNIPTDIPYLFADNARTSFWAQKLNQSSFKIGICWQGNQGIIDIGRSFPLSLFANISRIPTVELISLNKGHGELQLKDVTFEVTTLGSDFDIGEDAFMDTAAVMMLCDLVITSDTAIAHLAGALGKKTWVALKHIPEWRWLLNRNDSLWYPTMSLYRQIKPGDWTGVFKRIEYDLHNLLTEKD